MKYIMLLLLTLLIVHQGQSQELQKSQVPPPLSTQELEDFRQQAIRRIKELESYISIIADKDREFEERDLAIENALKLFTKTARMQVSRSGPNTITNGNGSLSPTPGIPIKTYFQRLKNLPYSEVKVTNFDAARVDKWERQKDGSYQATGYYFQNFQAWRNGLRVVNHLDKKKIDVDLRMRDDPEYLSRHWMVLFENVTVKATGEAARQ